MSHWRPKLLMQEVIMLFWIFMRTFSETWRIYHRPYYYVTTEFAWLLRLAAYDGVVLQRFEFIKIYMGKNGNQNNSWNVDIFAIKITDINALLFFSSSSRLISHLSSLRHLASQFDPKPFERVIGFGFSSSEEEKLELGRSCVVRLGF